MVRKNGVRKSRAFILIRTTQQKAEKWFSTTQNFSANSKVKETKPTQSDQCTLADGTHFFGTSHYIDINDWYVAVRKRHFLWMSEKRKCNQRFQSTRLVYMNVAKPIAKLRTPNGGGQSRSQRKCCNNKSILPGYKISFGCSGLNPEWTQPNERICFHR